MAEQRACDIPGYEYFVEAFAVDDVVRLVQVKTENVRMPVEDVLDLMLGVAITQFFADVNRWEASDDRPYHRETVTVVWGGGMREAIREARDAGKRVRVVGADGALRMEIS